MPEKRYWLYFETLVINPLTKAEHPRPDLIGPFSTPQAARECWRNVYAKRPSNQNPAVFYKRFDL